MILQDEQQKRRRAGLIRNDEAIPQLSSGPRTVLSGQPLLLSSGKDAQLWPASVMAARIIARLKESQHPYSNEPLSYASTGHARGRPYRPTTNAMGTGPLALGGTPAAKARAQADSWPRVRRFLSSSLMERERK
jgi:hypothetical protein